MGSLYTLRAGATAHPEDSVLQFITDLIASSGVVNLSGNHFKAEAQATPDMTVKVNIGNAYVKGSSGNAYPVRHDTTTSNVTITANSSGNPRIDAVVLYIDKSAGPNTDASNVAKLIVIAGTPGASPVAPTNSEIQTALGASNPFLRLADVTVASGATSITNGNIADKRVTFALNGAQLQTSQLTIAEQASTPATPSSGYGAVYPKTDNKLYHLDDTGRERVVSDEDWVDLTDGATITIDLSKGRKFRVTMGGNRTFALQNVKLGKSFILRIQQDATGGRTPTFWGGISWAGGQAPTITTAVNKADEFGFNMLTVTNDTTHTSEGFIVGQNI